MGLTLAVARTWTVYLISIVARARCFGDCVPLLLQSLIVIDDETEFLRPGIHGRPIRRFPCLGLLLIRDDIPPSDPVLVAEISDRVRFGDGEPVEFPPCLP